LACGLPSESGWLPAVLADGRSGYVQGGDLDLTGREWVWEGLPQLRGSLVQTARRFLGVPYLWGGTSAFGMDCSGFVQHVYGLHGLTLPRDADQQAACQGTVAVSRDEIVPGDLIFFGKHTHVGMAISHFEFIHATVHLDPVVQISRVDDPHWSERTDEIRRVMIEKPPRARE
jgi:cell wall-associated NlpC family hydrolase